MSDTWAGCHTLSSPPPPRRRFQVQNCKEGHICPLMGVLCAPQKDRSTGCPFGKHCAGQSMADQSLPWLRTGGSHPRAQVHLRGLSELSQKACLPRCHSDKFYSKILCTLHHPFIHSLIQMPRPHISQMPGTLPSPRRQQKAKLSQKDCQGSMSVLDSFMST